MTVYYRRYSGKIILDEKQATSFRGNWLEKRVALFGELQARGVSVESLTHPVEKDLDYRFGDWLFIEFAGINKMFFGNQIAETHRLATHAISAGAKVAYLIDDPELIDPKLPCTEVWANCQNVELLQAKLSAPVFTFPFHGFLPIARPRPDYADRVVYLGADSGGRLERLRYAVNYIPKLTVYAKGNFKSTDFNVQPPPTQAERQLFYVTSRASLALADNQHLKLGWFTGRIYHSLSAGCPVVRMASLADDYRKTASPDGREMLWRDQSHVLLEHLAIARRHLTERGL